MLTCSTEAAPLIRPFEGDFRLNSAMIPDFSGSVTYFFIETTLPSKKMLFSSSLTGIKLLRSATSRYLSAIIFSKIFIINV